MNTIRNKIGLKESSFVVGNCCNLEKEEDQATLLKTFRKLIIREINAELIFFGKGSLQEELKNMAEKFNIAHAVFFVHEKISQEEFYALCNVVVFSGFVKPDLDPVYKVMEAGKPVIATKIEGYRDIIEDAKTGFLVPCGFPERIEAAIKKLEANESLAEQMGKCAKESVKN